MPSHFNQKAHSLKQQITAMWSQAILSKGLEKATQIQVEVRNKQLSRQTNFSNNLTNSREDPKRQTSDQRWILNPPTMKKSKLSLPFTNKSPQLFQRSIKTPGRLPLHPKNELSMREGRLMQTWGTWRLKLRIALKVNQRLKRQLVNSPNLKLLFYDKKFIT